MSEINKLVKKLYLHSINNNIDFHTPEMRAFLVDSYENCKKYADGMESKDSPLPVSFSWMSDSDYRYLLKVSENSDMTNSRVFEADECSCDVYNLKLGTRYYWNVTAVEDGKEIYTSDTESFTTSDIPPRNLFLEGTVCNARDIGGWKTVDGKKVKQGLVFRTSTLDDYDPDTGEMRDFVDAGGKNTMNNILGIKTEIDFRVSNAKEKNYPPEEKTSSCLGTSVEYFHCPIKIGPEHYLESVNSIKTIFKILADESKYPVTYHCAVGADRTGAITYIINGLLGVSRNDLMQEYMITNFSKQYKYREPINEGYIKTIENYSGETLQEKIYNYLHCEIGVPSDELDFVIAYLTE